MRLVNNCLTDMKEHMSLDQPDVNHQTSGRDELVLSSLDVPISPPRTKRQLVEVGNSKDFATDIEATLQIQETKPSLAAVEAGEATISNHLQYFSTHLSQAIRPLSSEAQPRLSIADFVELYTRNQTPNGHHFVIHQHDHPIAGVHYDLRLQFSESSSISFAIMYGLPGNPNSKRLNRNAMETRVHCLWV